MEEIKGEFVERLVETARRIAAKRLNEAKTRELFKEELDKAFNEFIAKAYRKPG